MDIKVEKAISSFKSDLNCAQSVLSAYTEELNLDPDLALAISCGFGGGMGRLQETCGAVTGAIMVLGIYNRPKFNSNSERKEKTYVMVREFSEKFKALHGTTSCKALLNCDLQTEEGRRYAREHGLYETICEKCVADSVRIIKEL